MDYNNRKSQNKYTVIGLIVLQMIGYGCRKQGQKKAISGWENLEGLQEYQLTSGPKGHYLSFTQYFSPDDKWIVYDTRNMGSQMGRTCCIEVINTHMKETRVVYHTQNQTKYGPGVGTATFSPTSDSVLFIHGTQNSNKQRPYGFTRRTGVAVDMGHPTGEPIFMDARDVTPPFTPGALRGGTHAHTWSGDGQWVAFTYNDDVLAKLKKETNSVRDIRVVGIMAPFGPVLVNEDSLGENSNGQKFSVVVTRVTAYPKPGSDEISKAYGDGWVGDNGYVREDGSRQNRAIAFLGDVRTNKGNAITEVFIVDIPDDPAIANVGEPLEGTMDSRPMPPAGTKQRRLTYTSDRVYPGVQGPRHWVGSTPDGSSIFFLMRDSKGIVQIYGISPNGGSLNQITNNSFSIETTFNVSPGGNFVAYGGKKHVYATSIASGKTKRLSSKLNSGWSGPSSVAWSRDGRKIAYNRKVAVRDTCYYQIFMLEQPGVNE